MSDQSKDKTVAETNVNDDCQQAHKKIVFTPNKEAFLPSILTDEVEEIDPNTREKSTKTTINIGSSIHPLARRIQAAIDYKAGKDKIKLSWNGLAQALGMSPGAPTNWKKGKVGKDTLEKIAEFTEVDFAWLVTGDGEMTKQVNDARTALGYITGAGLGGAIGAAALGITSGGLGVIAGALTASTLDVIGRKLSNNRLQEALEKLENEPDVVDEIKQDIECVLEKQLIQNNVNVQKIQESGIRLVPLISFVQAGSFKEAALNAQDEFVATYASDLGQYSFALEIVGDSMSPDFRPGDKIIVDPDVQPMPGDFVIAQNNGHEATFKKYKPRGFDENGREYFELVALNENYPNLDSRFQDIRIIATVIDHIRKLRK